ncbi:hypothetical protein COCNU_01G005310 [Cocos nucifera]|uniref:Uncharacterized protein n=1 Tax=Cocos nucifera TaxID=13894 RepID=A0A8K0HTT3_COCNU|nr:hypothetical protein COCNU_01G005310 [Cocos nucifera]
MEIREQLPRSKRMHTHLGKHNLNKFCLYHRDHNHDIEECIQLQDEIEELIRRGRLGRFLRQRPEGREDRSRALPEPEPSRREDQQGDRPSLDIINTISEELRWGEANGSEGSMKRWRTEEPITFTEADAQGV